MWLSLGWYVLEVYILDYEISSFILPLFLINICHSFRIKNNFDTIQPEAQEKHAVIMVSYPIIHLTANFLSE